MSSTCFKTFGTGNPLYSTAHTPPFTRPISVSHSDFPCIACLTSLDFLSRLAVGLASDTRKQTRSDEPTRRAKKLLDGLAPPQRETHTGFTAHHAPPTWCGVHRCASLHGPHSRFGQTFCLALCRPIQPVCHPTAWFWQLSVKLAKQTQC
jgi:hypothetical protein